MKDEKVTRSPITNLQRLNHRANHLIELEENEVSCDGVSFYDCPFENHDGNCGYDLIRNVMRGVFKTYYEKKEKDKEKECKPCRYLMTKTNGSEACIRDVPIRDILLVYIGHFHGFVCKGFECCKDYEAAP